MNDLDWEEAYMEGFEAGKKEADRSSILCDLECDLGDLGAGLAVVIDELEGVSEARKLSHGHLLDVIDRLSATKESIDDAAKLAGGG